MRPRLDQDAAKTKLRRDQDETKTRPTRNQDVTGRNKAQNFNSYFTERLWQIFREKNVSIMINETNILCEQKVDLLNVKWP